MSRFRKLYAIVDRATLDARGVSVGAFAQELREAGVRLVQYRDKLSGPQEILRAAREIDEAFAGVEVTRIMNDRADLAVLAGWDGVHVGQGDLRIEAARRVLQPTHRAERLRDEWGTRSGGWVGVSTHNEEQVRVAMEPTSQSQDVGHPDLLAGTVPDYVAVGPVFATVSKANPDPVVGLEFVRRARAMTELPIVAIGGITLANARSVIEAGADSVAVIGGLFVEGRTVREVARDFLKVLG
jgi:thiamine-phosphate pyrophosphorylase